MKIVVAGFAAVLAVLALAGSALASTTIGSAMPPAGSTAFDCAGGGTGVFFADISDPVPVGGGEITAWQVNTAEATEGAPFALLLLEPDGRGGYEVRAVSEEAMPSPLPENSVVSFALAQPITAEEGDVIGIYLPEGSELACYFDGTGIPLEDKITGGSSAATPVAGEKITASIGESPGGYLANVAATFTGAPEALALSATAGPGNAIVGQLADYDSAVTNEGRGLATEVLFTETVPSGVSISQAVAGDGSCSVSGQSAQCSIAKIAPGASVPVVLTVVPSAPGSYASAVVVSSSQGASSVSASATLLVAAAPVAMSPAPSTTAPTTSPAPAAITPASAGKCEVPPLKDVPLSVAKRVLVLLDCKLGTVGKRASKKVASGEVIASKPGAGSYPAGDTIRLTVSRKAAKHKRAKKHGHKK